MKHVTLEAEAAIFQVLGGIKSGWALAEEHFSLTLHISLRLDDI